MAEEILIRRATGADAEALAPLSRQLFRDGWAAVIGEETAREYTEATFTPEFWAGEIAEETAQVALAVDAREQIAGFVVLKTLRPLPECVTAPKVANLQRLYVSADFRGKGVADILLRYAVESLLAAGFENVWLESDPRNVRAWRYYEKRGFIEVGKGVYLFRGRVINDDERILQAGLRALLMHPVLTGIRV